MKNKEAKSIFSSLENYSSTPPPELWDNIEAQLEKPKKKKRAIIWWSVAASLLIGFSIPTAFYFNSNQGNNLEMNGDNNADGVVLHNDSNAKSSNKQKDNGRQIEKAVISTKESSNDNLNSNATAVTAVSNSSSKRKDVPKNSNLNTSESNKMVKKGLHSDAVVSNQNSASAVSKIGAPARESVLAPNSKSLAAKNTNISGAEKSKVIAENPVSKSALVIDKSVQVKQSNASEKSFSESKNSNKGITESNVSKDSLSKIKSEVAQLEKSLVQLDKDKTEKKEVSKNSDKWSVKVFAGVMSSQNYNNETAFGGTVDSKQSSGYGVKTNYKLNKKWGVSTGFKINQLGQKIAGVSYYNKQNLYSDAAVSLPVTVSNFASSPSSNSQLVSISNNSNYLFSSNSKSVTGLEKGDVTQNLRYFEMPLEVSYSLLNKKKTNISMNTGGFVGKLISNDIALNGSSIGESKNVNDFVYGTLLSSTVQYEFLKKTYFFIEPGMNYYINPLENQTFNQFQWMFNVGVNVNF